jgi:hypothetical protein
MTRDGYLRLRRSLSIQRATAHSLRRSAPAKLASTINPVSTGPDMTTPSDAAPCDVFKRKTEP